MSDLDNTRAPRSLSDHVIIVAILLVAAVVYLVFSLASDDKVTAEGTSLAANQPSEAEMSSFLKNLPTEFEPLVSMGNALMDNGRYHLAVECYSRALEINPEDTDVRTDLGTCRHALGQNEQAIDDFMKVLEIKPAHQIARFNLGIVYLTLGDTTRTLEWWQKLLDENPGEEMESRLRSLLDQIRSEN